MTGRCFGCDLTGLLIGHDVLDVGSDPAVGVGPALAGRVGQHAVESLPPADVDSKSGESGDLLEDPAGFDEHVPAAVGAPDHVQRGGYDRRRDSLRDDDAE